ncbi:MAG: RNA polymerase sporulation sigma factor SigK [Clostridia bacterium]|nr:RNA polymerase sporulation sigma factor SigK [Clostridia bacterium]
MHFSSVILRFLSIILGVGGGQSFPPPLSAAEEAQLFAKYRAGDISARNTLIEHNLRLVSHIIRKYYGSYQYPDDLLSIGSLGLIKAVDTFAVEKGTRFATYGAKCVQNEILMFFRAQKKYGAEVSINETIDVDRDGNPLTYLDIIGVEDTVSDDIEKKIYTDRIRELVGRVLDRREKQIIVLRYGLEGYAPRTQREVAKHLGISRSYVSRIEKRALEKLKEGFGLSAPEFDS